MNFITKHLKTILLIAVALSLFAGLRYMNGNGKEYSRTEFLLNTECTVTAYGKNSEAAVSAAFDEIARIHSLTDLYDESSDISKINSAAKDTPISIDPSVTEILKTALEICKASDGAFDITVAPLSRLWNFGGKNNMPPAKTDVMQAKAAVDYNNIQLDTKNNTVTKIIADAQIDLGGAAKGYAADRAIAVLKEYGISAALVDLGGNVSCFGNNPASDSKEWRIGIQVPFKPTGEYSQVISVKSGSVVTSGTYQRNYKYGNVLYHHLLDPATGFPSDRPYDSVTITTDSALLADCLSTACFVLGEEAGTALAEKYNAQILFQ